VEKNYEWAWNKCVICQRWMEVKTAVIFVLHRIRAISSPSRGSPLEPADARPHSIVLDAWAERFAVGGGWSRRTEDKDTRVMLRDEVLVLVGDRKWEI